MVTKTFLISVKNDIGFRLFFADERNIEFLQGLLKSILKLDDGEYEVIEILDPHLLREFHGDKLGIVDVKVKTKTGKIIHIEIQLKVRPGMEERIIYYDAKLITEQIGSSDKYKDLKRVISIIITEETLIKSSPLYHHRFTFFDPNANIELSDLIEIHTLELNKLPDNFDGTELCDWAKFIAAGSEEELEMVANRNTQISKAVVKLRELSADEKARDMYERQEKARRDYEWALNDELNKQAMTIANGMILDNIPVANIIKYTGLTREEIEALMS
ncbi:MAG: Rpn family recombination-promoting nuclease/putative transposase [Oscillospiraceae bacterium]|nr:Rpn family recombination-promoting nuclease/putative transposase [Oscillospiraceae bacterium]